MKLKIIFPIKSKAISGSGMATVSFKSRKDITLIFRFGFKLLGHLHIMNKDHDTIGITTCPQISILHTGVQIFERFVILRCMGQ